jgi:hypothetical protein
MDKACSIRGKMRNAYKILVIKSEWNRPLGRYRYRWENNFKMDLKDIAFEGVEWIHLVSDEIF